MVLVGVLALAPVAGCWRTVVVAVDDRSGTPDAGAPSAGCGRASSLTWGAVPEQDPSAEPGSGHTMGHGVGGYVTIQSGGKARTFTLRLPDGYDPSHPYWLSFTFHPATGNTWGIDNGGLNGYDMAYYGLQKASHNGAIFVAPDGLNAAWANTGGEDLQFVDDIVKVLEENYCVDTAHVFAQGFAAGASLTYALACDRAQVFRGVALYEAGPQSGCANGRDPIGYWQMAGLTDTAFPIDVAKTLRDRFAGNNGCVLPTDEPARPPAPPPYLNPGGHVCTDYAGCSPGHPLRWCVHQSGTGNAVVDGTADLYNSCATAPKTCSATCPCTWVPDDVWAWMTRNF